MGMKKRAFQAWRNISLKLQYNRKIISFMLAATGEVGLLQASFAQWKSYTYMRQLYRHSHTKSDLLSV
jgi:hypothetical protein